MTHVDVVHHGQNLHGEGVLWNPADGAVWWTDIFGERLWRHETATGETESFQTPGRLCCFAPRQRGGLIAAFADRLAFYDPRTGALEEIARFEPDNPATRLNDGRTDRQGRFVAGGMNEATGAADSTVVRLDADGRVATLITGVGCANSTCFSVDGTVMYFADTPQKTIRAYPYDPETGEVGEARVHADLTAGPGMPDGSCIDAEGGVWNAVWEGRRVIRIAPDGTIDRVIEMPVWKPTCCAFGGADLETLFITTSRLGTTEDDLKSEPLSGALLAVRPGVRGIADTPFAG